MGDAATILSPHLFSDFCRHQTDTRLSIMPASLYRSLEFEHGRRIMRNIEDWLLSIYSRWWWFLLFARGSHQNFTAHLFDAPGWHFGKMSEDIEVLTLFHIIDSWACYWPRDLRCRNISIDGYRLMRSLMIPKAHHMLHHTHFRMIATTIAFRMTNNASICISRLFTFLIAMLLALLIGD